MKDDQQVILSYIVLWPLGEVLGLIQSGLARFHDFVSCTDYIA